MTAPLSENDIERVVRAFYKDVQEDDMPNDWDKHMEHITDFWSSIFLKTGRFKGNPMLKHAALKGLTPTHFSHWLSLFHKVSDRVLEPTQAQAMQVMADLKKRGKRIILLLISGCAYRIRLLDSASLPVQVHPFQPSQFSLATWQHLPPNRSKSL